MAICPSTSAAVQASDLLGVRDDILNLRRLKAWFDGAGGHWEKAHNKLKKIVDLALQHKCYRSLMLSLYSIGILYWRRGESDKAIKHLLRSFEVAKTHDLISRFVKEESLVTHIIQGLQKSGMSIPEANLESVL